jgi:hypothetical protein
MALPERGPIIFGMEHAPICSIRNQFYLSGPSGPHMFDKTWRVDHQDICTAIEETLEPFGSPDQDRIGQHANGNSESRPEIAHFE